MCKNFFLSPRSGICSERLFSPPSASGAPVCAVPCPRAAVLRPAAWVGRPRAGLLQGPVRPVGLRCLSGGRSHSATPPGAARPPAGLFVLKAVSGSPRSLRFHTRGAASPSAPPSASLAFSRAPALPRGPPPPVTRVSVCRALPWSRGAVRRSQRPATLCAGSYLSVSFPTPASTGARRRCRCAVDASRLLDA